MKTLLKGLAIFVAVTYAVLFVIAWFVHAHHLPLGCAPVGDGYTRCTYEVR